MKPFDKMFTASGLTAPLGTWIMSASPLVAEAIAAQLEHGSADVLGVMLESHLVAGRQDLVAGQTLRYGQSITDACIDFSTTERVLERLARAARSRAQRAA